MAKVQHAKKIGGKQLIKFGIVGNGSVVDVSNYIGNDTTITSENFFLKDVKMSVSVTGDGMWPRVQGGADVSYSNKKATVSFFMYGPQQSINHSFSAILYAAL